MFIERADGRITYPQVEKLASYVMNGRQVRGRANRPPNRFCIPTDVAEKQIKHAVGSARSIARENGQKLDVKHIDAVLEVVEAWNVAKGLK